MMLRLAVLVANSVSSLASEPRILPKPLVPCVPWHCAQFDASIASVADVGRLRVTLNATLGNYDPSYGEYLIRDIGPGSMITFEGLGEKASVKFSNGQVAQIWKVTPEEAKLVRDKVGPYGGVTLDLLLQITGVQPGTANAAIMADIVEFEMRTNPGGLSVARLKPGSEGAQ